MEKLFFIVLGVLSGLICGLGAAIALTWFLFDVTGIFIGGPDGLGGAGFFFFAAILLGLGGAIAVPLALIALNKKYGFKFALICELPALAIVAALFLYVDPMGWFCCSADDFEPPEVITQQP